MGVHGADAMRIVPEAMQLVFPRVSLAPRPHRDMPQSCLEYFEEARKVFADSPRASSALLRLCIEELCRSVDTKGHTLNEMIGHLVERGLEPHVQHALDIVRVTGDKSVHAGTINPADDPAVALSLFDLVNEVVAETISKPKRIAALYEKLPPGAQAQIARRDRSDAKES